MKKKLVSLASIAVVVVGLTFYVAYSGGIPPVASRTVGTGTTVSQTFAHSVNSSATAPPELFTVMIYGADEGAYFSPENVTLSVGAKVTWINADAAEHTVTSYNATSPGRPLFDSGTLVASQAFSYVFTKPGVYRYFCAFHAWMQGTIIVQNPTG